MPDFTDREVDLCIVGSGAGGGPMALAMAEAGAEVVVLEKGPWYKAEDFTHDEIAVVRRNMWVPLTQDEPHLVQVGNQAAPQRSGLGWIANCVGGGTVHMGAFVYRLHPEDFQLRTRYGAIEGATHADWPIRYEDLAAYYDRVEREVGVSGRAGANPFEPPRSGDYPMPPVAENPLAELVQAAATQLGYHPFPTPRAIASRPYRGRAQCVYCDFCGSYGCEVDAKGSTAAALIPRAVETGKCEIRPECMVSQVVVGEHGRVTGVRYFDAEGQEQVQRARAVCVSASSIETARLLLNSQSSRFPNGLANGSGLVGKNLSFSTLAKGGAAFELSSLPEAMRPRHSVHFLQRALQDHYVLSDRDGYNKSGTVQFLLPHRNAIYTAERIASRHRPSLWGRELKAALHRYYHETKEIEFETFGEFLPNDATEVRVDGEVKDRWEIPVATIRAKVHPHDVRNSRELRDRAMGVLEAMQPAELHPGVFGDITWVLQHGTCRFGTDPAESVLNVDCQAHEVSNLFVVDGSFMPTSGGVPSTLTIMANSFRVADKLVSRFRNGDLARSPTHQVPSSE